MANSIIFILLTCSFSLNPETWIEDSYENLKHKSLKEITLPGTHDSGSYYLTDIIEEGEDTLFWEAIYTIANMQNRNVGKKIIDWTKTQDLNLYEQMQAGARYVDLRAGWNKTTSSWVTFHFVQGSPLIELLQNISKFLKDYPKEIVVVEISHFRGEPTLDDIKDLKNMVLDVLGEYLHPVDREFKFTVGDMVSKGLRAVVTMSKEFDNLRIWPPKSIFNTFADTPDLDKMIEFNNKTLQEFMKNGCDRCLFKVSWTLTTTKLNILESLQPWKPQTLMHYANKANAALPEFWDNTKSLKLMMGNILIIDSFENSEIMKVIWESNGLV